MVSINGTTISMTRGDTAKFDLSIDRDDGTSFVPSQGDVVRFSCKKHYCDLDCVICKVIPNDTLTLVLDSEDTAHLPFGSYVYECELTYANGEKDTFIDRAILNILEEVN